MAEPAPSYASGVHTAARGFSKGPPMPYDGEWHGSLRAAIPETDLLHATLGASDVLAVLSPRPGIFMPMLRLMARLVPPWQLLRRAYLASIRGSVGLLRRVLFRRRPTRVVVSALAGRRGTAREGRYLNLTTLDGVDCGAHMIAACVRLVRRQPSKPGTYVIDEVLTLNDVLAEIAQLPGAPAIEVMRGPDDAESRAAT